MDEGESLIRAKRPASTSQDPSPISSSLELASLIDAISEGMVLLSDSGIIVDVNRAAEEILEAGKEQIVGKKYSDFETSFLTSEGARVLPEEMPCFRTLRSGDTVRDVEMAVLQPSGGLRRIVCTSVPIIKENGSIQGAIATLVDVTISRNIEQVLARNEATMRAVLEHAPFGILLIDKDYKVITMANRYAAELIGLPTEQIEGRVCHEFICPAEHGKCPVADLGQEMDNQEQILVTGDGHRVSVLKTVVPVELSDQSFLLDCFVDITDRKILESQLAQAQKLESVGRLAAGIAHEINTPSQYIGDNAQFLKDAFVKIDEILKQYASLKRAAKNGEDLTPYLEAVERAEEASDLEFLLEDIPNAVAQSIEGNMRVSSIVRAMKEFAHPGADQKVHADLNRALRTTVTVSRNEWKYAAEIELELDPTLPQVPCYPGEINQVFLNLIVNAAHAVADAQAKKGGGLGKIVIRTKQVCNAVEVHIEDNGTGIPEQVRDKIMDPFFTTKEVGKGTGQGLAIARSCITEKHSGTLTFETEEGKGTTFIVSLPLADSE